MLLIKKDGIELPNELTDVMDFTDELREINIPSKLSTNPIYNNLQYLSIFNSLMNNYGNEYSVLIPEGIDNEILGFTIGYLLLTSGIFEVIGNDELKSKIELLRDNSITSNDPKVGLIKKIIQLKCSNFKKFKSIISELKFENTLDDFILDGLVALYGSAPILGDDNTKFINLLNQYKSLWN